MKLSRLVSLGLLAVLSACSDAPTPTAVGTPDAPLLNTTVRVQVSCPGVLYVGNSGMCYAQGYDSNNNPTSSFASFSSANPGSVSVSGSYVTAHAPSGAWITAWIGGASGSTYVSVAYVASLTSISVSPNPASVYTGGTRQLTATGYDQYGATMSGLSFTWSSSNSSVASVSSSGLVSGVAVGSTSVTASASGRSGSATVNVTTPPLNASISGSQYVARHTSAQYTASTWGGTAPYTYEWRTRQGTASWWGSWQSWFSTGSTNYTYASINSCGLDRNQIEVRVTDAVGATFTTSYTVYITNPC